MPRPGTGSPSVLSGWEFAVPSTHRPVGSLGGTCVREYSAPLDFDVPVTGSLTDDIVANAKDQPRARRVQPARGAEWEDVTALAFHEQVRRVAKGLVASGLEPGDRVALLSRTRYEWTLVDYALWYVGAVTVPVYETASADQLEWLLTDSGATAIVLESAEHRARLESLQPTPPQLRHVWTLDEGALDDLETAGQGHLRPGARPASRRRHTGLGGHDHLHLRHKRPPEGMRSHARQLHGGDAGGVERAGCALPAR